MCGRNILQWIGNELTDHILKVLAGEGGSGRAPKKKKRMLVFFPWDVTSFKFLISFCSFQKMKGEKKSEKHLKEITFFLMAISIMILFFSGGKNSKYIPHLFLRAFYCT